MQDALHQQRRGVAGTNQSSRPKLRDVLPQKPPQKDNDEDKGKKPDQGIGKSTRAPSADPQKLPQIVHLTSSQKSFLRNPFEDEFAEDAPTYESLPDASFKTPVRMARFSRGKTTLQAQSPSVMEVNTSKGTELRLKRNPFDDEFTIDASVNQSPSGTPSVPATLAATSQKTPTPHRPSKAPSATPPKPLSQTPLRSPSLLPPATSQNLQPTSTPNRTPSPPTPPNFPVTSTPIKATPSLPTPQPPQTPTQPSEMHQPPYTGGFNTQSMPPQLLPGASLTQDRFSMLFKTSTPSKLESSSHQQAKPPLKHFDGDLLILQLQLKSQLLYAEVIRFEAANKLQLPCPAGSDRKMCGLDGKRHAASKPALPQSAKPDISGPSSKAIAQMEAVMFSHLLKSQKQGQKPSNRNQPRPVRRGPAHVFKYQSATSSLIRYLIRPPCNSTRTSDLEKNK